MIQWTELEGLLKELTYDVTVSDGGKGQLYFHGMQSKQFCEMLLETEEIRQLKLEREPLLVAALFHDIGKTYYIDENKYFNSYKLKHTHNWKDEHAYYGGKIFKEKCRDLMPEDILEKAALIIREHNDYHPRYTETMLLQDVDKYENLGFLGVWSIFAISSFIGQNISEFISFWQDKENRKAKHPYNFHFKVTKKIGDEKTATLRQFMQQFIAESEGMDIIREVEKHNKG